MQTPPPPPAIPFVRRDAWRGMFWLRQAFSMFRTAPLRWLLLIVAYYMLVAGAQLGPWPALGKFAAAILKPVFAVGFLAAAWGQERGGKPQFADLFRGFRSNLRALLSLGLVFFVGMTLAVGATAVIDGGALIAWGSGGEEPSEEVLSSGRLQLAMLFGILCALPTLLALWFAPALVVFHDAGALTALSTSLRAALANWRPVAVFGIAILFYGGMVPALGDALARLLDTPASTVLGVALLLPYGLIFLATLQITDYVAYRDVFHADVPTPVDADQAG
jgi:hypothetical protein